MRTSLRNLVLVQNGRRPAFTNISVSFLEMSARKRASLDSHSVPNNRFSMFKENNDILVPTYWKKQLRPADQHLTKTINPVKTSLTNT